MASAAALAATALLALFVAQSFAATCLLSALACGCTKSLPRMVLSDLTNLFNLLGSTKQQQHASEQLQQHASDKQQHVTEQLQLQQVEQVLHDGAGDQQHQQHQQLHNDACEQQQHHQAASEQHVQTNAGHVHQQANKQQHTEASLLLLPVKELQQLAQGLGRKGTATAKKPLIRSILRGVKKPQAKQKRQQFRVQHGSVLGAAVAPPKPKFVHTSTVLLESETAAVVADLLISLENTVMLLH